MRVTRQWKSDLSGRCIACSGVQKSKYSGVKTSRLHEVTRIVTIKVEPVAGPNGIGCESADWICLAEKETWEHFNEPPGSVKFWEFLEELRNSCFLKRHSAWWSYSLLKVKFSLFLGTEAWRHLEGESSRICNLLCYRIVVGFVLRIFYPGGRP
jgi:hypothetical protein